MRTDHQVVIHRSDYTPPTHLIDQVSLGFELEPSLTRVTATLTVRPNPKMAGPSQALRLYGEQLQLETILLNGVALPQTRFEQDEWGIVVHGLDAPATLTVVNTLNPLSNTTLNGLYVSNGNFYSQCEAQGFRRITFFPDRPDVMSIYTVTIEANAAFFPVLLSNGNLAKHEVLGGGRHRAVWCDPFPKPSYLFALVAGKFEQVEKKLKTMSGREVALQFYVEPGNITKTDHAMQALVDAMQWDETRYGLELDLERYMVVAVSDFNMGAMENKGLNVFNTKYVFANPLIATDIDYANIESVIGHEYFHNWTGNRVTCRDWFQLTLKEGLTVFRDQEFSADMSARSAASEKAAHSARAVKRIEDVRVLRMAQFPEDAGPMAHPIRPESYQEINNFYTATVYEKGAEVIRMLQTLVGREGFRAGMDLYFKRHDGQAVTCDDFVCAIADANKRDLSQFMHWYRQAGTPTLQVQETFEQGSLRLHVTQMNPPVGIELGTAQVKPALLIPIRYALLDAKTYAVLKEELFELTQETSELRFDGLTTKPIVSFLRGFSAPVNLEYPRQLAELGILAAHDADPFNRWEALQQLASRAIRLASVGDSQANETMQAACSAFKQVLLDQGLDHAFKAEALTLPAEAFLAEQLISQNKVLLNPSALRSAREQFAQLVGTQCSDVLATMYQQLNRSGPYQARAADSAERALKRAVLFYWCQSQQSSQQALAIERAQELLQNADNMTDRETSILALRTTNSTQRDAALTQLEALFTTEPLAMDKWFSWQSTAPRLGQEPGTITRINALAKHHAFTLTNPNRVRSLLGGFFASNLAEFHSPDGSGYTLWANTVIALASINPQVAARMARALDRWNTFTTDRQVLMRQALEKVAKTAQMPADVLEIVNKALAASPKSANH
jgi:aminopeptidase N